jgi:hypothetical protein
MSRFTVAVAAALTLGVVACADSSAPPTVPTASQANRFGDGVGSVAFDKADARTIGMYDSCDPATFNAVFNDPTICIRQGEVVFDRFIGELTHTQKAAQWHFAANNIQVDRGDNVFALNKGGEVHTFTRVANFGGGILPLLNDLSGNTTVAPECTTLEPDDFVAPGALYTAELNTDEIQHFQCCIHPWMRADVRIKHG